MAKQKIDNKFSKDAVNKSRLPDFGSSFAKHFVETGRAELSAIKAGIPREIARETAQEYLRNPSIIREITELRQDAAAAAMTNDEWITKHLKTIIVQCMEQRPILTQNGKESIFTSMDNPAAALKGLEMLGKHVGMFTDNTRIELKQLPTIKVIEEQTDEPCQKK